jgi:phytoene desaturase
MGSLDAEIMPRRHYAGSPKRVAIVGGGLGGLSAAIHLRLRGFDVTMYEANARVGGRANVISRDGFTFDTGPSLVNYPWVFEDLFAAAGKKLSDYVTLLPVDPTVQFQWRDKTHFHLSSDAKHLLAECERLEPGSGPTVMRFLRDAGNKYGFSFSKWVTRNEDNPVKWIGKLTTREMLKSGVWHSLDSELGRFFQNHYIREALGSYAMYLGGSPYELPGLFSILSYGEIAMGLWLPKGGVYSLVCGIVDLAREVGVQIHTKKPVSRITHSAGRVTGVEFANGKSVAFDVVVSNVDRDIVGEHPKPPRMTPGVITFYWGVRGNSQKIGHHTIFLPDDNRGTFDQLSKCGAIPTDLPFYVSIPSATDPHLAPRGNSAVFVLVPTPVLSQLPDINWESAVDQVRSRVFERLALHEVGLRASDLLFEEVWTPLDWQRRFGLFDGSAFGAAHTLFQMGPFRTRNYSRRYEGLYYVGAGTTPGTGMPMVVLGGKMTAERIASRVH